VSARGRVTRYRRLGTGWPVVLLAPGAGDGGALWPGLAEAVAAGARALLPALDAADAPPAALAATLRGFLDGLGLGRVSLVAAAPFGEAALRFARGDDDPGDGDRVECLVVVPAGATPAAQGVPGLPLLVLARETPAAEALPQVTRFVTRFVSRPG
jgi:hypothetical protein